MLLFGQFWIEQHESRQKSSWKAIKSTPLAHLWYLTDGVYVGILLTFLEQIPCVYCKLCTCSVLWRELKLLSLIPFPLIPKPQWLSPTCSCPTQHHRWLKRKNSHWKYTWHASFDFLHLKTDLRYHSLHLNSRKILLHRLPDPRNPTHTSKKAHLIEVVLHLASEWWYIKSHRSVDD